MKKLLLALVSVLVLSGCKTTEDGESIEDCLSYRQCLYLDQDIKTEGSDFANSLVDLLLDEEDNMTFSFVRNRDGNQMSIIYESDSAILSNTVTELKQLKEDITTLVDTSYDMDYLLIRFDYREVDVVYVLDTATLDEWTTRVVFPYDDTSNGSEQAIITYVEDNSIILYRFLDAGGFESFTWYQSSSGSINIYLEDDVLEVYLADAADTEAIEDKVEILLDKYTFEFKDELTATE